MSSACSASAAMSLPKPGAFAPAEGIGRSIGSNFADCVGRVWAAEAALRVEVLMKGLSRSWPGDAHATSVEMLGKEAAAGAKNHTVPGLSKPIWRAVRRIAAHLD